MHIIRNNGKIFPIQEDVKPASIDGRTSDITLNTENVIYETPVEFVVTEGHAGATLQLKHWEMFQVLCGGGLLTDNIPTIPELRVLDHTYISDWDTAVREVIPDVLPDYPDSTSARSAGLTDGQFYRTGDFVKQLFTDV